MTAIVGPGFRAFSAASQGDWDRAREAVADIPREEWTGFVTAVDRLAAMARVDMGRVRRHRLCDNCTMHDHARCTGHPCGCTSEVCHPPDPPATPE